MVEGYVKPVNQILADIEGFVSHEYKIGGAATELAMIPGSGVIYDTNAYSVKESGAVADDVLGVLDVADDKLITDHYSRGDTARVIERGKCLLRLANASAAVAPGDAIVSDAAGTFVKQAVGLIGAQGAPVAYALETCDPSLAEKLCLCFVTGQREAA